MKFLCVAFLCVLGVPQIKCNHEDGIFIKIGSYGNNQTETIKEFFLSERFEESWMSAFMFCLKNEMELLRLNSHDELSAFVRAFKYHWLDFGDAVYVDGFKKNDKKWIFLTNKVEIDRRIYDVKKSFDDVDECMLLFKKFAEPSFGTTNCFKTRRKFVCQKVTQGTLENVETGPLKVDVQSRIFEEIGSFADLYTGKDTLSTFYLNRYYDKLSPASASSFCESFNMNLVQVDSMEKLKTMMRHILKQNNRLEENFLIGGSRSTVFENLPLIKLDSFGSHGSGRCLSVTTETRKDNLQIYYFSCAREYDDKPLGFICEKLELNGGAHEETSIESRAIGLKLLGVLPVSDYKNVTIYISDQLNGVSFFNAFSYCKTMGMDLYSPQSKGESQQLIILLSDYSSTIAIGVTRIGTEGFWYSTKTGKEFIYKTDESPKRDHKCLQLKHVRKDAYQLVDYNCEEKSEHFICESPEI